MQEELRRVVANLEILDQACLDIDAFEKLGTIDACAFDFTVIVEGRPYEGSSDRGDTRPPLVLRHFAFNSRARCRMMLSTCC